MELVDFLHARLGEDEQAAKAWPEDQQLWEERGSRHLSYASGSGEQVSAISVGGDGPLGWERIYIKRDGVGLATHIARHDPARVLREVEAKRRILAVHRPYVPEPDQSCLGCAGGIMFTDCPVVRLLALPYADHPDYQQDWKP